MEPRLLNFAGNENGALDRNAAHLFASGHALCIYSSNAVYSLIPKNACSTMRFSIAVANGAISRNGDVRWIHSNNRTFTAGLRELATAEFTFVILRCPFDRLVSCFLNKIVDMRPDAWALTPSSESDVNPGELSFRTFVEYLHHKQKLRANVHWRPQSDFLVYRKYDRYFDFKRMRDVETELRDRIKLEVIDTRSSIGHSTSNLKTVEGKFSDTPVRELSIMKSNDEVPSLRSLFDDELWGVVHQLYERDFTNYRDLAAGQSTER